MKSPENIQNSHFLDKAKVVEYIYVKKFNFIILFLPVTFLSNLVLVEWLYILVEWLFWVVSDVFIKLVAGFEYY